jgi:hypothetical protein
MPVRERARRGDELVTVLEGKIGGRGKTTIRNQFGYTETVKSNTLTRLGKGEPERELHFGADE